VCWLVSRKSTGLAKIKLEIDEADITGTLWYFSKAATLEIPTQEAVSLSAFCIFALVCQVMRVFPA